MLLLWTTDKVRAKGNTYMWVSIHLSVWWVSVWNEVIGDPSIFNIIRSTAVLVRMWTTFDLICEENTEWWKCMTVWFWKIQFITTDKTKGRRGEEVIWISTSGTRVYGVNVDPIKDSDIPSPSLCVSIQELSVSLNAQVLASDDPFSLQTL